MQAALAAKVLHAGTRENLTLRSARDEDERVLTVRAVRERGRARVA